MEQRNLMDAHVLVRRMYNLLNEVMDVSRQMVDAVDRGDQVSVSMLLSMRQGPINQVQEVDAALRQLCGSLPSEQDRIRLGELLRGLPADDKAEEPLAAQIGMNARLLKQVRELDRRLSRKLIRDRSVYET